MMEHAPVFVVLIPLTMAALSPLIARISRQVVRIVMTLALAASTYFAFNILTTVLKTGPWHYHFGDWEPPWGIEYVLDPLNASLALLVAFIATVVSIYSWEFLKNDNWMRNGAFNTLYGLLASGLLGMVVTGDAFNLYVFLEISSLSAYALIAMGGPRGTFAALRYLLIGTIGATLYLLGLGYIYAITGTLNMADMSARLQPLMDTPVVLLAVVMMLGGLGIKMGLFPLHFWLPDSYTFAYPPAIALIAGVMTKVSAYILFRFYYFIFLSKSFYVVKALEVAGLLAAIGIIVGSIMAIAQKDFRRMLAYSSVAQIGYIIIGFSIGNVYALIGALFHIANHALMKSSLFLIAGSVNLKYEKITIDVFRDIYKKMPLTMICFLISAFSMVGIPPTAGFFSKWYIILGALEKNMWIYIAVIIISSLLNAIYFFRIIEFAFMKEALTELKSKLKSRLELPLTMLLPIIILSSLVLVLGIFNEEVVSTILQYALPEVMN